MKRAVTTEVLRQYCKDHDIVVRAGATRSELEAAITRAALHDVRIESESCFGYWSISDIECEHCSSEDECFNASLGLSGADKEKYIEQQLRIDRIRLVPILKKRKRVVKK